jgi:conjugative transfer signal peptidase TraF
MTGLVGNARRRYRPTAADDDDSAMRRRQAMSAIIGACAIAALLIPALHRPHLRLVWNRSPSVPLGLYRIILREDARVGDLVAVRPLPRLAWFMADRHYVEPGALLLKPVAASGGATICRNGLDITIDGVMVAVALMRDRIGRSLPQWNGCRRLAPDELFLLAPARPDSFDSRYFGPVGRSAIVGSATPLWTRG